MKNSFFVRGGSNVIKFEESIEVVIVGYQKNAVLSDRGEEGCCIS